MDIINRRPGLAALAAFIAGLIIGLVVLGWGLFPVQYSGADPSGLFPEYQAALVRGAADLYAFDNNQEKLRGTLGSWGGDKVACDLARNSLDSADQNRLVAAATVINGTGCESLAGAGTAPLPGGSTLPGATLPGATAAAPGATKEAGSSGMLPLLLLGLLLLLLLAAIFYVWNRRRELMAGTTGEVSDVTYRDSAPSRKSARPSIDDISPGPGAAAVIAEPTAIPIARFRSIYTRGNDSYNDKFNIENAAGDFLGECGVDISETIGATTPKNVTAFEIWLFDKNDIRTITKVIMSDHAFFDEALKAKLAPKGEPVLARRNETIVLETAKLIINAEITELDYGDDPAMADASYFDRFTIELSAWAQEDDYTVARSYSDEEDLLNY